MIVAHRLHCGRNDNAQLLKLRVIGVLCGAVIGTQLLFPIKQLLMIFAIIILGRADPIGIGRRQQLSVLHPEFLV